MPMVGPRLVPAALQDAVACVCACVWGSASRVSEVAFGLWPFGASASYVWFRAPGFKVSPLGLRAWALGALPPPHKNTHTSNTRAYPRQRAPTEYVHCTHRARLECAEMARKGLRSVPISAHSPGTATFIQHTPKIQLVPLYNCMRTDAAVHGPHTHQPTICTAHVSSRAHREDGHGCCLGFGVWRMRIGG
jgi:hypothetical protein